MTALKHVNTAAQESINTVSGAARVVTSPFATNRSTPEALDKFVRERVGTILDGVLIIPSTAVLYTLVTDESDQSVWWRGGKGVGIGIFAFLVTGIVRRGVM